jgi:crossover junction endodeoxyribonuclease RuvC
MPSNQPKRRIIAIDPGYERLGIAVVEKVDGKERVIYSDCFKTSPKTPHPKRLLAIGEKLRAVIAEYQPTALAAETLFLQTNQKTVMAVAEARGVILYAAACYSLPVWEFSPLQIKMAVTGYGRSDKRQLTGMVKRLVKIEKKIIDDDEFDAIAVGLTFFAHENSDRVKGRAP